LVINKRIPDVRGDVLRKAREAKGLTVADLATKVCFSSKQIEQLENGEKSHFYSLAIKANAARRVADELNVPHEEVFDFGADLMQSIQDAENSQASQTPPADKSEVVTAVSTVTEPPNPESEKISNPKKKKAESKPEPNEQAKVEQLERFEEPKKSEPKKSYTKYYLGAAVLAVIVLVAINLKPSSQAIKSSEIAKLPSEIINNSAEAKKEDQNPSSAPVPSVTSVASPSPAPSVVASTAPTVAANVESGCPTGDANAVTYRSPAATKPGNMVYVQTRNAQTICVKDATGKLERKTLDQGGSYSFYGKAPFVLMTSGLGQTDIFFQGYKVRVDNPNVKNITLEEIAF
jgi:transcriptional regulator with XRE-family HTH domain